MILNGKCKEEFEKWLIGYFKGKKEKPTIMDKLNAKSLPNSPNSMQWGVYQDYFDSVGVKLIINYYDGNIFPFRVQYCLNGEKWTLSGIRNKFETRPEARTAAIEKACEIRNQQLDQ